MTEPHEHDRWRGLLSTLPVGGRIMLTAFLVIIGSGYLIAVVNIYYSHNQADGQEGLSLDDVRAVYSGLSIARTEDTTIPSRMLTMIRGQMRQYIDDDEDFVILETWLKAGGIKTGFTAGPRKKTPRRVMTRHCLRCHAQSTGTDISTKSPFGPDEFSPDYGMLSKFVAPDSELTGEKIDLPPQYTIDRLVLVSHIHMLAIPTFTLIVGVLFMLSRLPMRWRSILTPLPMLAVLLDFAGWWLARIAGPLVYVIIIAGAVFGAVFGIQIIVVALDLWRPAPRP